MGQIIDGKKVAADLKEQIKKAVEERKKNNMSIPKIASILVGDDGGSVFYMNAQQKAAESLGVEFLKVIIDENESEEYVIDTIHKLNEDDTVNGIILQLPLPKKFNETKIVNEISTYKDIDCMTYESQGRLYMGKPSFLPNTPNSVVTLIKSLNIDLSGKNAVIIGRSNVVGKPLAQLLLNENATVTICHSRTKNLKEICKKAEILVVAMGKPKFIDESYVNSEAVVIDVGTSRVNGKMTGDVDFDNVFDKCKYLTPVPGGVGSLTTTLLINNACEALSKYEHKNFKCK